MEKAADTIKLFIGERSISGYLKVTHEQLAEFDSQCVDNIRSEFVIHKSKENLINTLKEYKRVLKKGKTIVLSVPDFYLISSKYSLKMKIEDINRYLGGSEVYFDFISLQKTLIMCGFFAVKRLNVEKIDCDDKFFFNQENISLTIEAYA